MIEEYPISIDKNKRIFQVRMLHSNGDESLHAWFTYDGAVQHIETHKNKNLGTDRQVSAYEILIDNCTNDG